MLYFGIKTTLKKSIHLIELSSGSNGLDSGNTREETTTQAACEVFKRCFTSKIVAGKIICPTTNPDTIQRYIKRFKY